MKFNKTVLDNGLRIVTVPMKESTAVTVLVMVEAGSKYETKDINGLSHFLEHMCFKGTEKRNGVNIISRELDSLGAQYNAFTSQEFTGYYAKVHPGHFEKALDIIADMYLHPTLPEKEIEKEKGVIIEEINMYEDLPQRHVHDIFMELLYGDQPAGWNIAGPKETVKSMRREHFASYRSKHYVAKSTVIVIAGNFKEEDATRLVEKSFAGIIATDKPTKLPVIENQKTPQIRLKTKKTDQAHAVLGFRTFSVADKRMPALQVLQGVLGAGMSSRLFQKLRDEMGVCYYVKLGVDEYTDHGYLAVSTGLDTKRVSEALKVVCEEFMRLKTELVSPEELKKTKDCLIGNMYLGLETSDSLAEFYGIQEVLKGFSATPKEFEEKIEAVTAEEIQALVKDIIQDKNLNLALISSLKDDKDLKKILHV